MKLIGENLVCERGGRTVFSGISFTAESGELLVLRGRNGAGKTSLLRMIAGLNEPVGGQMELQGGRDDEDIALQCQFIAHQEAFKPAMTVAENLQFWSDFFGGGDILDALEAFSLEPLADFSAALLSAGQKRRLALGRLAMIDRPVWLLDEPTVGLDVNSTEQLRQLMRKHLDGGGIILATTHIDLGIKETAVLDFNAVDDQAELTSIGEAE